MLIIRVVLVLVSVFSIGTCGARKLELQKKKTSIPLLLLLGFRSLLLLANIDNLHRVDGGDQKANENCGFQLNHACELSLKPGVFKGYCTLTTLKNHEYLQYFL